MYCTKINEITVNVFVVDVVVKYDKCDTKCDKLFSPVLLVFG